MPRVLLVDDNEKQRDELSKRLQRRGFDVVTAGDGQEAVNLAKSEKPDVILMDLYVPVLDSWEATRQIKTNPESAGLPILCLTADAAMPDDIAKVRDAGCHEFHAKPVDLARLIEQIEALIIGAQPVVPPTPAVTPVPAVAPAPATP